MCVPHINDVRSDQEILTLSGADVLLRPNMESSEAALRRMIDDLSSAAFVLAGALHAAIVAHAYDIPFAYWDDGFLDLPFKWRDFAGSIGVASPFVRSLDEGIAAFDVLIKPRQQRLPLSPILRASPFSVRSDVIEAAARYDLELSKRIDKETGDALGCTILADAKTGGLKLKNTAADQPDSFIRRLDRMIGQSLENHEISRQRDNQSEKTQAALQTMFEQMHQTNEAVHQIRGDISQSLTTLATAVDKSVSEMRLGAALADAQHHLLDLQAKLKTGAEELAASRQQSTALEASMKEEQETRSKLQSRVAALEADLKVETRRRDSGEADYAALSERHVALSADLARTRERAELDLARAQERAEKADAALSVATKQGRRYLATIETHEENARAAEAAAQEFRDQLQSLNMQRQMDVHRNARLLDDYARRLHIFSHRADVLMNIADVRQQAQARRIAKESQGASSRPPALDGRRQAASARKRLASAGLFSAQWYRQQEPAAAALDDAAALAHFVRRGLPAGRDPHPLVSMAWLSRQSDTMGTSPLVALLDKDGALDPHPLFDTRFYLETYPDVANFDGTPFQHYLVYGASEGRQPHPAFDPTWYRRQRPNEKGQLDQPLIDYVTNPEAFAFDPHPLFDAKRYLRSLAAAAPTNPLIHYVTRGEREGRIPHPLFEPDYYLQRNPDVAAAGISPYKHFLRFGAGERRVTHPLFDPLAYAQVNAYSPEAVADPLRHYVVSGAAAGLATGNPSLTPSILAEVLPALDQTSVNPLVAFLDGRGLSMVVKAPRGAPAAPGTGHAPVRRQAPQPVETFALPQRLREYVDQRFGPKAAGALQDLMAVVDRFGDRPNAFVVSPSYEQLVQRLAPRSAKGWTSRTSR